MPATTAQSFKSVAIAVATVITMDGVEAIIVAGAIIIIGEPLLVDHSEGATYGWLLFCGLYEFVA